jgi:hypothetical protein
MIRSRYISAVCAAALCGLIAVTAVRAEDSAVSDRLRNYFSTARFVSHEESQLPGPVERSDEKADPFEDDPKPITELALPAIPEEVTQSAPEEVDGTIEYVEPWEDEPCQDSSIWECAGGCRLIPSCDRYIGPIRISGWIDQGFSFNPDYPTSGSNLPVTFNDRANRYQMNQLYLVLEKEMERGCCWEIGGRVDLVYGTDYYFTTTRGLETHRNGAQHWNSNKGPRGAALYGLAMPQAYAEAYIPFAEGLSFKIGHFYTILGYEFVPAPQNFFYSHSYAMQYGEPFTHSGILASLNFGGGMTAQLGATHGSDSWDYNRTGVLVGASWRSCDERLSLAFSLHSGPEDGTLDRRSVYSLVGAFRLTPCLTYVLQHDRGWDENAVPVTGAAPRDGDWYGINNYLLWDLNPCWSAGMRFEWFRDSDGIRVPQGANQSAEYFEITVGLNYSPNNCWTIRPELRWDWVAGTTATPYNDGTGNDQFMVSIDAIYQF